MRVKFERKINSQLGGGGGVAGNATASLLEQISRGGAGVSEWKRDMRWLSLEAGELLSQARAISRGKRDKGRKLSLVSSMTHFLGEGQVEDSRELREERKKKGKSTKVSSFQK